MLLHVRLRAEMNRTFTLSDSGVLGLLMLCEGLGLKVQVSISLEIQALGLHSQHAFEFEVLRSKHLTLLEAWHVLHFVRRARSQNLGGDRERDKKSQSQSPCLAGLWQSFVKSQVASLGPHYPTSFEHSYGYKT